MSSRIEVDFGWAMSPAIGPEGLAETDLATALPSLERAIAQVAKDTDDGRVGFAMLPSETSAAQGMQEFARALPASVQEILVLGIGGSSLGARAIVYALGGPPELVHRRPRRLYFPDNSDPRLLAALLDTLGPHATLVVAVSKSGETVETAAQLLIVQAWLRNAGAPLDKHLVVITDPEKGELRALAKTSNVASFEIPPNVGGRFSVLSPAGLVPAALAGLDAVALLDGARAMRERCKQPTLDQNPAAALASVLVLHHRLKNRPIHVLMPYADALRGFASWYVQLWAESLGKRTNRRGEMVECGPTPVAAIGATDQHAQLQLFMEGPRDKVLVFVDVVHHARDLSIPSSVGPFDHLGGHSLAALLRAQLRGTRAALARDRRPSVTLRVDSLDERSLGAMFFLFEAATAIAGELYDIHAFDQPGVEQGKRLTAGLCGRPGFEKERLSVEEAEAASMAKYRAH